MTKERGYQVVVGQGLNCHSEWCTDVEAIVMTTISKVGWRFCAGCAHQSISVGVALSHCLRETTRKQIEVQELLQDFDALLGPPRVPEVEELLNDVHSFLGLTAVTEPARKADAAREVLGSLPGATDGYGWTWSPRKQDEHVKCDYCPCPTADFVGVFTAWNGGLNGCPPGGYCKDCAVEVTAHLHQLSMLLVKAEAIIDIQDLNRWEAESIKDYGFIVIRDE